MRKTCLEQIYHLAKKDKRIVFIGSDLSAGTLSEFAKEMPERFFMEGVYEQHLIGMAAGMAKEGKIVYVNTVASFITRRCFEQIMLDLGLHNLKVRLIGNGGGLVYAPLGPTHTVTEDIAIMKAIPNMAVIVPADGREMEKLMPSTVDYPGPIYIRLAKGNDPIVTPSKSKFQIGKAILIKKGSDGLIITTGITLKIAKEAAKILRRKGLSIAILHVHTVKPLDTKKIAKYIKKVPLVVSVEEHSTSGGLGTSIAEVIAEGNFPHAKKFKRIGLPDAFPKGYGSQKSLLEKYSLTSSHLVKEIIKLAT